MLLRFTGIILVASLMSYTGLVSAQEVAKGVVYNDTNNNSHFDAADKPLEGIRVSNGREIVKTGADGSYQLPIDDDTILFVIKPKGWRTAVNDDMLPQFYYTHKPAGSPKSRYPGVAPTGPLPKSVDFALYHEDEPDDFNIIVFGDPQPRNQEEVNYVIHDAVEPLIGVKAAFGISLGDLAFNNLDTLQPQNHGIAKIGIPWYNVIGNHDSNINAKTDSDSDETFNRIFGPNYYSFDYGNVHFLVLDDVYWNRETKDPHRYHGKFTKDQLAFIKNDLALLLQDQLAVLTMHIPLEYVENHLDLFHILEHHQNTIAVTGHTHTQYHVFFDKKDGWTGDKPLHEIVNATVCGSWWSGTRNEYGIPNAMMADGAPNGYSIMNFKGYDYTWEFHASRHPKSNQMRIWAPESVPADATTTDVVVNIFGGSSRNKVAMKVDAFSTWTTMTTTSRPDPFFIAMKKLEPFIGKEAGRKLPDPQKSRHLWVGALPKNLIKGVHTIHVRTTDMFGKTSADERTIRVE